MDQYRILPWITLSSEVLGSYPIFELSRNRQRSPLSGREHSFLRLDCPDWVNVIAVTEDGMTLVYTDGPAEVVGFIDITDPTNPVAKGAIALEGEPTSVSVFGDFIARSSRRPTSPSAAANRCSRSWCSNRG